MMLFNLIPLLCMAGSFREAIKDFDFILQRDPKRIDALTGRGLANHALGELKAALVDCQRAVDLALTPKEEDAFLNSNLGQVLMEIGDFTNSLLHLNRAISLDAAYAEAYGHRALLRGACPEASIRSAEKARDDAITFFALDGETFWTYRVIAAANAELGDFSRAEKFALKSINLADASVPMRFVEQVNTWKTQFRSGKPYRLQPEATASTAPSAD